MVGEAGMVKFSMEGGVRTEKEEGLCRLRVERCLELRGGRGIFRRSIRVDCIVTVRPSGQVM